MSPEQTIIFSIVGAGISAFFGAYLGQKGKDFATKEDIAKITRIQEEIRTELANRSHFSRVRDEREMEIYREAWKAVHQFYLESVSAFGWEKNVTANSKTELTKESWQQSSTQLARIIQKNKPFYSDEIWIELSKFSEFAFLLAVEYQQPVPTQEQVLPRSDMATQAKQQYQQVESAIRKRLEQFDKAN